MAESVLICAFAAWMLEKIFAKPSKIRWLIATVLMVIVWHMTLRFTRG